MAEITSGTYVRRCNRVSAAILSAFESSASIPPLRQTLSRAERSGRFRQVQPSCRHTAPIRIISYSRSSGTCTPCNRNHRPFGPELRPEQGWFHEEQVGNRYSLASPSASIEIGRQPAAIGSIGQQQAERDDCGGQIQESKGQLARRRSELPHQEGLRTGKRHIAVRRPSHLQRRGAVQATTAKAMTANAPEVIATPASMAARKGRGPRSSHQTAKATLPPNHS